MKISLWGHRLIRSVRTALVLTQRGGSCPRSFPFVLGANRTCTWEAPAPGPPTRQPRWGGVAERKRSGPPARGWLAPSTQGPLVSCRDMVLEVCVVVLIAGALRRMRSHAETPSHQDPRHRGWGDVVATPADANHASDANQCAAGNCIVSVGTARPGRSVSHCVRGLGAIDAVARVVELVRGSRCGSHVAPNAFADEIVSTAVYFLSRKFPNGENTKRRSVPRYLCGWISLLRESAESRQKIQLRAHQRVCRNRGG